MKQRDPNVLFDLHELQRISEVIRWGQPPINISETENYVPSLEKHNPNLLNAWEEFIIAKRKLDQMVKVHLTLPIKEKLQRLSDAEDE